MPTRQPPIMRGSPMETEDARVGWWERDRTRSNLRTLVEERPYVLMAGAWDAWSATLVERAGVEAIGVTGVGTAGARGWPDLGMIGAEEFAQTVEAMRRVVEIPILCDVDTGFGGPVQVARTIRLIEEAGGNGVHIEDQENPKQTGLTAVAVVDVPVMVERIAAACAARSDPDFLIIARCDAALSSPLDDAIERCQAYLDAGADGTMLVFPRTEDEMQEIGRRVPGIKMISVGNHSDSWKWSFDDMAAAGFSLIDAALYPLFAALEGMTGFLDRYVRERRVDFVEEGDSVAEIAYLNELLGYARYDNLKELAAPTSTE